MRLGRRQSNAFTPMTMLSSRIVFCTSMGQCIMLPKLWLIRSWYQLTWKHIHKSRPTRCAGVSALMVLLSSHMSHWRNLRRYCNSARAIAMMVLSSINLKTNSQMLAAKGPTNVIWCRRKISEPHYTLAASTKELLMLHVTQHRGFAKSESHENRLEESSNMRRS